MELIKINKLIRINKLFNNIILICKKKIGIFINIILSSIPLNIINIIYFIYIIYINNKD